MKNKETLQPKTRQGSKNLKEFYSLSKEEYNDYIISLYNVPVEDRTDVDKFIVKYFNLKPVRVVEEFFIDI